MWRVKQTINDAENGDCLAACVSAIFEIPLEDVPNFVKKDTEKWEEEMCEWFYRRFGLQPIYIPIEALSMPPHGYAIMTIRPKGFKDLHAVVLKNNEFIWNPAPGYGTDIEYEVIGVTVFHVVDCEKYADYRLERTVVYGRE